MEATEPAIGYTRPWLYPKQSDALFCAERYAVTEATTKAGKTVGALAWLLEQAIQGTANQHFWWIAPVFGQTKIAYRRLKHGIPHVIAKFNESELTATLLNAAVLEFKSAEKPDNLFGEDVYAAVMDEASRQREEAWHAIRTTLTATRGPLRIIGNVKGRKNWAYQLARKAEAGEPGWHYAKLTAHDAVEAGILDAAEVEDARRQLPDAVFRELYLAEPSDDAGNPFGLEAIRACVGPLSDGVPVTWGWDLAKSVDWTVGVALDASGAVCRVDRWQQPWGETMRDILGLVQCSALVDATGVGDPVLEQLQRGSAHFEGFKFSSPSKQQIMEGLAVAIQQKAITYPDGVIVRELESFEYVYSRTGVRYSAPEGQHDDCVCALALAVQHWRARASWTLKTWTAEELMPLTKAEQDAAEREKIAVAAQAVTDEIARVGVYFPGG